jgi:hypothetical protein
MLISICTLVPEFNGLVSKRAKRKRGLFALFTYLIMPADMLSYYYSSIGSTISIYPFFYTYYTYILLPGPFYKSCIPFK